MKLFNNIFNWYFGRRSVPFWTIVLFDLAVCFFGGLFVLWVRYPKLLLLNDWTPLVHSLLAFAAMNLIGFKTFHT